MCPAFCCFMWGRAAAIPYNTPLIFTSIVRFQSSILRRSRGRVRHQPGVVDYHVDAPERLHGCVHQMLHLTEVGDIGSYRKCFATGRIQLVCQ